MRNLTEFIFEVAGISAEAKISQELAQLRNQKKRENERKEQYVEWSKPENIETRKLEHTEVSRKSFESIRQAWGIPLEDEPLPENLPAHMKGQPPSTIRAMLRQEKEWTPEIYSKK